MPAFPQASCGESDPRLCYSVDTYLEEVFLRSDTNIAVLSAVPGVNLDGPLSPPRMDEARRAADALCGDGRVLMHGQAQPQIGDLEDRLDEMNMLVDRYPISSWKLYTHTPGRGWFLDDHEADAPQVGQAFLDRARETGVKTVSVHKGLSNGDPYSSPVDIGPAAKANPDLKFVVYHSGYENGFNEGPTNPAGEGVDRLIESLRANGIGPNENVYAELGSTWFLTMRNPEEAAHVLGKLLKAVGPKRIVWGTDSIWYGTPQNQIEAFRTFEISPELQDRYGYPALTKATKRRILGLNAARLYGVDPIRSRCDFTPEELEEVRQALPAAPGVLRAEDVRRRARRTSRSTAGSGSARYSRTRRPTIATRPTVSASSPNRGATVTSTPWAASCSGTRAVSTRTFTWCSSSRDHTVRPAPSSPRTNTVMSRTKRAGSGTS